MIINLENYICIYQGLPQTSTLFYKTLDSIEKLNIFDISPLNGFAAAILYSKNGFRLSILHSYGYRYTFRLRKRQFNFLPDYLFLVNDHYGVLLLSKEDICGDITNTKRFKYSPENEEYLITTPRYYDKKYSLNMQLQYFILKFIKSKEVI